MLLRREHVTSTNIFAAYQTTRTDVALPLKSTFAEGERERETDRYTERERESSRTTLPDTPPPALPLIVETEENSGNFV